MAKSSGVSSTSEVNVDNKKMEKCYENYILIDIGANLTHKKFLKDLESVIARAKDSGVQKIMVTGTSIHNTKEALRLTRIYPDCLYCTAGIHPHEAKSWTDSSLHDLKSLALNSECVAVGECGLDYNRDFSPPPIQREVFEQQVKLACELNKPLFLHEREAHEDLLSILNKYKNEMPTAVIHCFTGTVEEAKKYLEMGFYIGLTGYICKEKSDNGVRKLLEDNVIPLERLLVETDAPFMYPNAQASKLPAHVKQAVTDRSSLFLNRYCTFQRNEPCSLPAIVEMIAAFMNKTPEEVALFCQYTRESLIKYHDITNIIFCTKETAINLFWMIQQQDLIHRKLLYIFYWGHETMENGFSLDHFEAMRIVVISSPRLGTYRVYYSQADPSGSSGLLLVNWWSSEDGLFRSPVLPIPEKVYQNFKGRIFEVPVLHKPPWNFVEYTNDSFRADGGRDDKLLTVIAENLNFRYRYVDPPERLQGSGMTENGTFPGVLGQVWQRDVDFFMGDVTITYERSKAVEFSFFTLVDSEAFVTHRPSKLNEALALIRPFQCQVWPPIVGTFALYGPILFAIIEAPYVWKKTKRSSRKRRQLFWDCVWFSTSTFLRQGGNQPGSSHKVRLVLILVTLGATYVIGDMYSANLTSLLARPGREKPITVLEELEMAMNTRGYELLVEKHSSSYSTLQNGTGIYERLWKKMQTQSRFVIESVELGMKLVRKKKNFAVLGGRETLYFDTKRFGSYNFHLSEKLNTRYSAIAMQQGCPYIENFNRILIHLFEGGILTKMTEEEYERLGEKQRAAAGIGETDEQIAEAKEEVKKRGEASEEQSLENLQEGEVGRHQLFGADTRLQLQPISTRMLQGAFYILIIGYIFSGDVVLFIPFSSFKAPSIQTKNRIGFNTGFILFFEIQAENIEKVCRRNRHKACCLMFKKCDSNRRYQFLVLCSRMLKSVLNKLLHVEEESNTRIRRSMPDKNYLSTASSSRENYSNFIL